VDLRAEDIKRPNAAALAGLGRGAPRRAHRLIASVRATETGCEARVDLVEVSSEHPLFRCHGAGNAVVITLRDGRAIECHGRGAGRWPTALRDVISAGEALRVTPGIRRFFERTGARLHNHYGPTETHVRIGMEVPGHLRDWPEMPAIGLLSSWAALETNSRSAISRRSSSVRSRTTASTAPSAGSLRTPTA